MVALDDSMRQAYLTGMQGISIRTEETRARFFRVFVETGGCMSATCRALKMSRFAVWKWRKEDPAFDAAVTAARRMANEALEDMAIRRAMQGWIEPVYQKGERVGEIRKFDNRLLERVLEANMPEKYGRALQVSVGHGGGGQIIDVTNQAAELAAASLAIEVMATLDAPAPDKEKDAAEAAPVVGSPDDRG